MIVDASWADKSHKKHFLQGQGSLTLMMVMLVSLWRMIVDNEPCLLIVTLTMKVFLVGNINPTTRSASKVNRFFFQQLGQVYFLDHFLSFLNRWGFQRFIVEWMKLEADILLFKSNKLRYLMSHMGNLKLNQPTNLIFYLLWMTQLHHQKYFKEMFLISCYRCFYCPPLHLEPSKIWERSISKQCFSLTREF